MKNFHIRILFFVLLASIMSLTSAEADPYRPDSRLKLLSEYPSRDGLAQTQTWEVDPVFISNTAWGLNFFTAENPTNVICRMTLRKDEESEKIFIEWEGVGQRDKIKTESGFFMKPGYPAPCDILPVEADLSESVFTDTAEAAGYKFVKTYRITRTEITVGEAVDSGWIRESSGDFKELVMINVQDDQGRTVVKQLWVPEQKWWIYEETPFRRSWLVSK